MNILIVDDSNDDQFLLSRALVKAQGGLKVATESDASHALDKLKSEKATGEEWVIFLDINMPKINGFEFLKAMAAEVAKYPTARVVMYTSSTLEEDRAKAMGSSLVVGYLEKPATLKKVQSVLGELKAS